MPGSFDLDNTTPPLYGDALGNQRLPLRAGRGGRSLFGAPERPVLAHRHARRARALAGEIRVHHGRLAGPELRLAQPVRAGLADRCPGTVRRQPRRPTRRDGPEP